MRTLRHLLLIEDPFWTPSQVLAVLIVVLYVLIGADVVVGDPTAKETREAIHVVNSDSPRLLQVFDIVLDSVGRVHILTSNLYSTNERTPTGLVHWFRGDKAWHRLEVVSDEVGVRAATAETGRGGRVYALWCEPVKYTPGYVEAAVFLQVWSGQEWERPIRVSDDDAKPARLDKTELALLEDREGNVHAYWTDWREEHVLQSLIHGEGQFSKSYTRILRKDGLSEAVSVQGRGQFDARELHASMDQLGKVHAFWVEDGRKSEVKHSVLNDDGWSQAARVWEAPKDVDIFFLSSMARSDLHVIWDVLPGGIEYVSGSKKSWSGPLEVARRGSYPILLSRGKHGPTFVYQISNEAWEGDLYLSQLARNDTITKSSRVVTNVGDRQFDATMDSRGTVHFGYIKSQEAGSKLLEYATWSEEHPDSTVK